MQFGSQVGTRDEGEEEITMIDSGTPPPPKKKKKKKRNGPDCAKDIG
jgi:hypothetical protein